MKNVPNARFPRNLAGKHWARRARGRHRDGDFLFSFEVKEKLNRPDGNSRVLSLSNAYPFPLLPFCPCVYRSVYANNRLRVRARAILKLLDVENGIWRMMGGRGGKECILVRLGPSTIHFLSFLFSDHHFEFTTLRLSSLYSDRKSGDLWWRSSG